jgi:hypothetical protein
MWMLAWFLVCRSFIWPVFSQNLVGGIVAGMLCLAGATPALAAIYRVRQIRHREGKA